MELRADKLVLHATNKLYPIPPRLFLKPVLFTLVLSQGCETKCSAVHEKYMSVVMCLYPKIIELFAVIHQFNFQIWKP